LEWCASHGWWSRGSPTTSPNRGPAAEDVLLHRGIWSMRSLTARALAGFVKLLVILSLSLFLPAWSLKYWEAWVFLIVFFIPVLLITVYFLRKDPDLIERRLKAGPSAEDRSSQKVIQSLASLFFILVVVIPGFDHRLNWSHIPAFLVITADVVVLLGLVIVFYVFKENSFTSAVVEVAAKQQVISTGPYAVVRHPMYSGALLLFFFTPIALGSWWALPIALPMLVVIVLRLLDEEELLHQSLSGYEEYCQKIQYRLIPHIW
jgi:protein-S-isoprenylcysteine O-methyltransferase Ste14